MSLTETPEPGEVAGRKRTLSQLLQRRGDVHALLDTLRDLARVTREEIEFHELELVALLDEIEIARAEEIGQ